ncbi:MAG TPA: serine hydrolase domain-containing protein, partial [Bryobacteraceae bacterium]|nr:serine hydrolase domain-containing protein [Bryobacteraceae bacterium]
GDPQFFAPGTKYLYSTRGYTLLGALAEQASGLAFRDLIRTYVFGPAGMTNARVDHAYELIPNRVRGYFRSQNGDIRNAEFQDTSAILPGGGLCGTAEDLARFGAAVMNRAILNPRTVASMWTPQRTIDGGETGYGLGWYVAGSGASLRVWHGGAQSGARGLLLLYPPQNAGVALLTNIEQVDLRPTARALVEEHGLTWSQM